MSLYYELDPASEGSEPQLPPLLKARAVDSGVCVATKAMAMAAAGEIGVVCHETEGDVLRFAVTLAPEVDSQTAVQMHHAMMIAIGDAIGANAPPEVGVTYRFPGEILLNHGLAGRVHTHLAERQDKQAIPEWMVVAASLRLRGELSGLDSGIIPDETTLAEEGGSFVSATRLLESTTRHFLVWLSTWEEDGFKPLFQAWKGRLDKQPVVPLASGQQAEWIGLDASGAGLAKIDGNAMTLDIAESETWFGPLPIL